MVFGHEKHPLKESIHVKEGHSTTLTFSEEEKADVIVSETFGVLLLQDSHLMVVFLSLFLRIGVMNFPKISMSFRFLLKCTSKTSDSADPDDPDQEGCLESFAHANQHLAKPKPTGCRVPCGGAQMLRLLSSKALRDATGGCLPEEFKHLACWRDTGRCSTICDDHLFK